MIGDGILPFPLPRNRNYILVSMSVGLMHLLSEKASMLKSLHELGCRVEALEVRLFHMESTVTRSMPA